MPKHKYAVGDRVVPVQDASNRSVRPGVYTIVRQLPIAGRGYQYRAKSALDTHERVFDENLLRHANG